MHTYYIIHWKLHRRLIAWKTISYYFIYLLYFYFKFKFKFNNKNKQVVLFCLLEIKTNILQLLNASLEIRIKSHKLNL